MIYPPDTMRQESAEDRPGERTVEVQRHPGALRPAALRCGTVNFLACAEDPWPGGTLVFA
jgi:hypothetical protein